MLNIKELIVDLNKEAKEVLEFKRTGVRSYSDGIRTYRAMEDEPEQALIEFIADTGKIISLIPKEPNNSETVKMHLRLLITDSDRLYEEASTASDKIQDDPYKPRLSYRELKDTAEDLVENLSTISWDASRISEMALKELKHKDTLITHLSDQVSYYAKRVEKLEKEANNE